MACLIDARVAQILTNPAISTQQTIIFPAMLFDTKDR